MNTSVFKGLEDEKAQLQQRARTAHKRYILQQRMYYNNSERFTLIVLLIAGAELFLVALLFDYMIALNFVLTRILLWLLIGIVLVAFTRFMHILVFLATHHVRMIRTIEDSLRRRVRAIEHYESGIIDDVGIRMLYEEISSQHPLRNLRVVEFADWVLYSALILSGVLFGLVFL